MQCRMASVETQVERVLEAQIQTMEHQRTVDDRRYDEALKQFRDIAARLEVLEAKATEIDEEDDDSDEYAHLYSRMNAFERMVAVSEEAMDYRLTKINTRARSCEAVAKQIDTRIAEFVDLFNSRADALKQCLRLSEGEQ